MLTPIEAGLLLAACLVALGATTIKPARAGAILDAQTLADSLWAKVRNYEASLAHIRPDARMLEVLAGLRIEARQAQANADRLNREAVSANRTHPRLTEWTL